MERFTRMVFVLMLCCVLSNPVYAYYEDVWHAREEKMEEASIMYQLFFSNAEGEAINMLKWYAENKHYLSRDEKVSFLALDEVLDECDRRQHEFMDAYWFYHKERIKRDRDLVHLQERWETAERKGIRVDTIYVMVRTLWLEMTRIQQEHYQTDL